MKKRSGLKKVRKERRLSQKEVALTVKISRSYYTQIELGSRDPGFETARKICEFLCIDLKDW